MKPAFLDKIAALRPGARKSEPEPVGPGPGPPSSKRPGGGRVALGLLLIGTGRTAGFAQFGNTGDAFLASLAPLVGILIVLCGLIAWSGRLVLGLTFFLFALCDLLAPSIIADLFCRLWNRRERWGLHANILNCSQWLIFAVLLLLLPLGSLAIAAGLPASSAAELVLLALCAYIMWFHWFAARHALMLSPVKALLVMMTIVFGTGLLLQVPVYAGLLTGLQAPPSLSGTSPLGDASPGDAPTDTSPAGANGSAL